MLFLSDNEQDRCINTSSAFFSFIIDFEENERQFYDTQNLKMSNTALLMEQVV